jgi:hypothetical protein
MLWIVILGILLILIIAIIITMFKIIRGSNDIQETKERSPNKGRGAGDRRGQRDRGSNDRSSSNRSEGNAPRNKPKREAVNHNQRPSKESRPKESAPKRSGGPKRRWKVILIDVATHEEYEFIFSNTIGIGRAYVKEGFEDYLVINDPKVSKLHCSIFTDEDNLYIQDEGSSNYTFVNESKVNKPAMIQKEDLINIGNTELEVLKVFRESR